MLICNPTCSEFDMALLKHTLANTWDKKNSDRLGSIGKENNGESFILLLTLATFVYLVNRNEKLSVNIIMLINEGNQYQLL